MGGMISKLVFQPPRPATYSVDENEFIWLVTALGERIPAVYIPHPKAEYTILFSHGNAEDLGCLVDWLYELS